MQLELTSQSLAQAVIDLGCGSIWPSAAETIISLFGMFVQHGRETREELENQLAKPVSTIMPHKDRRET